MYYALVNNINFKTFKTTKRFFYLLSDFNLIFYFIKIKLICRQIVNFIICINEN